jgi:hypothetical protein
MEVEREGDRYRVDSVTLIAAPAAAVFDVLADYQHLHELSSAFEETRVVSADEDGTAQLVYLRARGCVLFFCKTLERYESMTLDRPREIVAVAVSPPTSAATTDAAAPAGDGERSVDPRPAGREVDADAAIGQVAYSRSRWYLEATASGTRVTYAMEMEPDFWVPPLVGPWALKRKLVSGADDAADRLERRARGEPVVTDP